MPGVQVAHRGNECHARARSAPFLHPPPQRRDRFDQLQGHYLNRGSGLRPLHPQLPLGTVPLNFPVLVDDPARLFPVLKEAGVPIWRFGEFLDAEVTEQLCPNSCHLSRSVFQFPCHSELRQEELDWMIDTILTKLKQATAGPVAANGS